MIENGNFIKFDDESVNTPQERAAVAARLLRTGNEDLAPMLGLEEEVQRVVERGK